MQHETLIVRPAVENKAKKLRLNPLLPKILRCETLCSLIIRSCSLP